MALRTCATPVIAFGGDPGHYWFAFKSRRWLGPSKESAAHAKQKIEEVLKIMNLGNVYPVYQGSNIALENDSTAIKV